MRIVTNPGVDFRYTRTDTVYRYGYGGFNNLIVGNDVFPIHLEDYDDFNIAAFKNDSIATIVYSGAQGALKNEFLSSRNKAFTEFTKKDNLFTQPSDSTVVSLDSLIGVWTDKLESMPFSPIFKADETMFYKSYQGYLQMIFKLSESDQLTSLSNAAFADFPNIDFQSERYYTTIAPYKVMAQEYHFKKILELEKVRYGRRYINRLNSFYLENHLKTKAYLLSTEHHPRAEFLYDISKPQFNPHSSRERRFYKNSQKNGVGSEFEYPEAATVDNSLLDFSKFKGKNVNFFIYSFADPYLGRNISKWNRFAVEQESNTYNIAYAIDATSQLEVWKKLQFSSQIAGLNVKGSPRNAFQFKKDLGLELLPRVISIDTSGKIKNPNLDLNFEKTAMDRASLTIQQ
ncbi:hypothetical protein [Nonlabens sp. Hel1_33_55]|uniref:hypothetical protein n=1 Tax=Nonlabens sp. Hel1_33_55 TaxID=1336802 RepID=UPI0012FD43FB|nr:hypothetical protein [Nonlabens sp. Hel1_33_55]